MKFIYGTPPVFNATECSAVIHRMRKSTPLDFWR